ncbi:dihydrofolate synthase [Nakamurella antarctica]|uniref:Dihydrofolate synthase/folylpolyglutamate synthase n=1 Tax=Nakamurella antarctica TaxID=1902245 RepID=A0A3G8ZM81_9ACTN|nr:cyanophycin synthetase [Nakamurella antarctica]AZI58462.1 dihydrofolate synthase [Nakamurella antarctica]
MSRDEREYEPESFDDGEPDNSAEDFFNLHGEVEEQVRAALGERGPVPTREEIVEPDPTGEIASATADLDDQEDLLAHSDQNLDLDAVEDILNLRWPETKIEPSLHRISRLLQVLGSPETSYPVIQVAGTNGKTSTARMIDALISRIGLRTGRFTSPHLQSVTERISLDALPISEDDYVRTFADISPFIDLVDAESLREGGVALSKFEILTAMAYAAFADAPVEVAVVEVGLGGTWDSTNVVDAHVAVIAPVGMDHMHYLGDTITAIAGEKAGIIKVGATVIIAEQESAAMDVIIARAVAMDATVARYGSEFSVLHRDVAVGGQRLTLQGLGGTYEDIFLPLHGTYQAHNAAVALAAVEAFFGAGPGKALDLGAIQDGFAAVASPGRLERIGSQPTILIDAAHNPHGAKALAVALTEEFSFSRLVGVIAIMGDKDARGILTALVDSFDAVVVTTNSSPRTMNLDDLAALAVEIFGEERVHTARHMRAALALATELAGTDQADSANADSADSEAANADSGSGIVVTGSVVSAGDARALAGRQIQ